MLVGTVVVVVLAATLTVLLGVRANGRDPSRCERFAADSRARAAIVTGRGGPVVVIGDSWSAGLGLDRTGRSWPSRLDGSVRVEGFSGSGFSAHASGCGRVSFGDRARRAVRAGARLVVVEGGLNDVDQSDAAIRRGFRRLLAELGERQVVVVGPASAPARAADVPRVDALLSGLAERWSVPYIRTSGLQLGYLPDGLHLTLEGHEAFGDFVRDRLAELRLG